ncbi:DUF3168 domain-containing protein [Roseovarius sp. SCSIO 43702]|uniref:DUF3168 domain-containing protein n=1 Tax=Roseovarius sp. SCSIO 43702 TaxID=2823043 RepID=UPI001C739C0C|nr:DUF3168 domain-containing protein [Roseovarius sp. SCSIO 43702]QYX56704.1 DUF3168 domain-containing protein [Roseovarius sp. SCSIO 43702]
MSYGVSSALQSAIYTRLTSDPALAALVGTAIYDALPAGALPSLYVALGPEDVRPAHDKTGGGAWHRLRLSVVTDGAGFQAAKEVAGAISDALADAPLPLSRGRVAAINFHRARARREGSGDIRRIDLVFRARTEDIH